MGLIMTEIIATASIKGEPCIITECIRKGVGSIANSVEWKIQSMENANHHASFSHTFWCDTTPFERVKEYRAWTRNLIELRLTDFCWVDVAQNYEAKLKAEYYGAPTCVDCAHCHEHASGFLTCDAVSDDNPFGSCYLAHCSAELLGAPICDRFEMAAC